MSKLDDSAEQIVQGFTRQIQELYGEDLISVILYGSAAGADYIPGRSDLNFLIVLKEVTPQQLKKSWRFLNQWHKQGISTPLFLDPSYIKSSVDVYPIEFLDMQEQHRLLAGEDVLKDLKVSQENLRLQCEQELKGKLLHLRRGYLETGGDARRLEELMLASLKPFGVILRNLLRLQWERPPHEFLEIINETERAFNLELEAFREVYQLKLGYKRLERSAMEALFESYLSEVKALASRADALLKKTVDKFTS